MNTAEIIFHHVEQFPEPVQAEVLDFVLFLQHKTVLNTNTSANEKRARLREVMLRLQESCVFSEINDPVMWQRDTRTDRNLPGREH